jgi:hypothetical protein
MFLVKITRNRGRGSTWVCLLGAVHLAIICLMLIMLMPKFSRLYEVSSAGMGEGDRLLR